MRYTFEDFKVVKEKQFLAVGLFGDKIYAARDKSIESIWIPNSPFFYKFYEISKELFDAFPDNYQELQKIIFDSSYDRKHYLCSTFYEDVNNPDGYFDRVDKDDFEYYLHLEE